MPYPGFTEMPVRSYPDTLSVIKGLMGMPSRLGFLPIYALIEPVRRDMTRFFQVPNELIHSGHPG
jgi:hypothetical protein